MNPQRTHLYDLADAFQRLAPWRWMDETQVIGLRHPETGELGWMSLMGAVGSHTSLALYLGDRPLDRFNLIQRSSRFLAILNRCEIRPSVIRVSSESARSMLAATARALGVPLANEPFPASLDEAMSGLMAFLAK